MEGFILKENEIFKIIVLNDRFEIHQSENQKDMYLFKEVDSLKIGKRVNFLVSVFSFLVGIFIGEYDAISKENDQLKFNYKNKLIVHSLKGAIKT